MSKPTSSGQSIPVAILVSQSGPASKSNKPAPQRKSASAAQQLPWLWIATGGCAVWILVVLAVAAANMSREPEQPAKPNLAALAKLGAVEPAFQAPAGGLQDIAEVDFVEPDVRPNVPVPKLPFRQPAVEAIDEAPPLNVVKAPDIAKQADPDAPIPGAPAKKAFDANIFASCEQIGTNVLFVRDPPEAFKRARAEKKMVFVVHLSGNLEDKEFT